MVCKSANQNVPTLGDLQTLGKERWKRTKEGQGKHNTVKGKQERGQKSQATALEERPDRVKN